MEILDPLCIASGSAKQYSCWGNSSAVHQRINLELPYDPAIPLLGIYLKELKAEVQTNMPTFTAAYLAVQMVKNPPARWETWV